MAKAPKTDGGKKKDNTLKIVLIVVGALVGLGLLFMIAGVLFFGSLFDRATDGVDVDENGGKVTIQSDDGQSSTQIGENAQLAEGFPEDVPIYEPSTLVASSRVNETQFSATARTDTARTEVQSYYKSEMAKQGWEMEAESTYGDGSITTYKKGDRTASVSVNVQKDEEAEKTFFVVSVASVNQ